MASQTLSLADLSDYLRARADTIRQADLTKPLKTIRLLLVSSTKQNFASGSDPDGNPWEPLKRPRSRKRDKRKGRQGSDLPLRDTGVLMASVTASGVGSIDEVTSSGIRFGTSVFYAGYQNFGTRYIPARRFLGINDALRERIRSVLTAYVAGLLKGREDES